MKEDIENVFLFLKSWIFSLIIEDFFFSWWKYFFLTNSFFMKWKLKNPKNVFLKVIFHETNEVDDHYSFLLSSCVLSIIINQHLFFIKTAWTSMSCQSKLWHGSDRRDRFLSRPWMWSDCPATWYCESSMAGSHLWPLSKCYQNNGWSLDEQFRNKQERKSFKPKLVIGTPAFLHQFIGPVLL